MPKISIPLGPQQYALDTVFAGQAEFVAYRYCQKRRRRISTKKILLPKVNFIKLFINQNFIFQNAVRADPLRQSFSEASVFLQVLLQF